MITFPHINLLHNVVTYANKVNTDPEVPEKYRLPGPVTFKGTVKLHGSNCGVVWDPTVNSLKAQSREADLTPEADYKGFAVFVGDHGSQIRDIFRTVSRELRDIFPNRVVHKIAVYGEWVGAGVVAKTKGAAVAKFDPLHWALFAVYAVFDDPHTEAQCVTDLILDNLSVEGRIGNVRKAGSWTLIIDFNDPASVAAAEAEAMQIVSMVESQCPYGALYGLQGAGEGVVWMPQGSVQGREDLYWKIKTAAHSVSREPKVLKERPTVPESVQEAISEFLACTVTGNRLDQSIDFLEQTGLNVEKKNTGVFLRWIVSDIERECTYELEALGLQWDQVQGAVTQKAREWFLAAC